MKKPALLLLLACVCAALVGGCSNLAPAFTGLTASLAKLEREAGGTVTATVRYANPNLAAYNVGKAVHRVTLDGAPAGTLTVARPFGIPPQANVEQKAELKLEGAGAAAVAAALARGSAYFRIESNLTFQLLGDNREVIKSSSGGTVPVTAN